MNSRWPEGDIVYRLDGNALNVGPAPCMEKEHIKTECLVSGALDRITWCSRELLYGKRKIGGEGSTYRGPHFAVQRVDV